MEIAHDYEETFSLPSAGPSAAATSTTAVTAGLEAAWADDGGGLGGTILDERLTDLGRAYMDRGHVRWDPPPDLDRALASYLSRSVTALNSRLDSGELTIDATGNIRPPRNLRSTAPLIRPREA